MLSRSFAVILALLTTGGIAVAQSTTPPRTQTTAPSEQLPPTKQESEVMEISRQKWLWMAERNTAALDKLVDENAVFVHMGATMTKAQELDVIKSGRIEYKQADIQNISAKIIGDTAIVLSTIQLFALVGGNEARNPFTVTETYIKQNGAWKLGALAFTRRVTPQ
jgi:4-carboxymuconolactone decarboxylase